MIVIKNVFGGSKVYIKNVFAGAENLVVVYNGGDPISVGGSGGGVTDHGALTGLADDDHTQYHNDARGDLRYEPLKGADDNYVTDAEKIVIGNTSGTNTGDQDLSTYALNSSLSELYDGNLINAIQALGSELKGWSPFGRLNHLTLTYTIVDGRQFGGFIYVPVLTTITGIAFFQGIQGNYTADNTNSIALYSYSAGTMTKVAETANDENIWKGTANTLQKVALTAPYEAAAGIYFVAGLYNSSAQTTAPTISTASASTANASLFTLDFTNSAKIGWFLSAQNSQAASIAMSAVNTLTQKIGWGYY